MFKMKNFERKIRKCVFIARPLKQPKLFPHPACQSSIFRKNEKFYQLCLIFLSTSCTEVSSEYWCQSALTSDEAINVENKPATRQTSLSRRRRIMRAATAAFSSRSNLTRWKLGQMKTFHKIDTSFLSCASRFELHAEISRREKRISSERMVQL